MNDSDYKNYLEKLNKNLEDKSKYRCKACSYIRIGLLFSSGFLMHCLIMRIKNDPNSLYYLVGNRFKHNKAQFSLFVFGVFCYYISFKLFIKELNIKQK